MQLQHFIFKVSFSKKVVSSQSAGIPARVAEPKRSEAPASPGFEKIIPNKVLPALADNY